MIRRDARAHPAGKGARLVDLPVEHPTKFELIVDAKTAKTLGMRIPRSVRVRGDQVIA